MSTYSKNTKLCAVCGYWDGPRTVDKVGIVVQANASAKGVCRCQGSACCRTAKLARVSCSHFELWVAVTGQTLTTNTKTTKKQNSEINDPAGRASARVVGYVSDAGDSEMVSQDDEYDENDVSNENDENEEMDWALSWRDRYQSACENGTVMDEETTKDMEQALMILGDMLEPNDNAMKLGEFLFIHYTGTCQNKKPNN